MRNNFPVRKFSEQVAVFYILKCLVSSLIGSGGVPLASVFRCGCVLSDTNPALHRCVLGKGGTSGAPEVPGHALRATGLGDRPGTMARALNGAYSGSRGGVGEELMCSAWSLEALSPKDWDGYPAPLVSGLLEGALMHSRLS